MKNKPAIGDVWEYPYLWKWQAELGEDSGRKPRPTLLAAVVPLSNEETDLYLIPITGTQPTADRDALEIPTTEVRRAGLSEYKRLWIIFDEHNLDVLEQSFYFELNAQVGSFSRAFIKVIAKRFMSVYLSESAHGSVDRRE